MTTADQQPPVRDGYEYRDVRRSLPIALLQAREAVMDRFRPMLNTLGVTEQQWRVLRVLHETDTLDATQLAERACIRAPSLTRILRAMEERGFIASAKDERDARRSVLQLTGEGRSFIAQASTESARIYAEIEETVGAEHIARLLDEVERLRRQLSGG